MASRALKSALHSRQPVSPFRFQAARSSFSPSTHPMKLKRDDSTLSGTKNLFQEWAAESRRYMSSVPPFRGFEDANPTRIEGIKVNPESVGNSILPGNLVYKFYKWTGNTRKIPLELAHGYFWMVADLKKTGGKPTLSNDMLIPAKEAQVFPTLTGLESLCKVKTDLPYFCLADKDIKCTLVNISFRDSGYKNIESWTKPFEAAFSGSQSVKAVKVSITERRSLYWLRGTLSNLMRNNTPVSEHENTLIYFGSDVDDFRDILRMHNIMTNYVFLVDHLGRVRFASSGKATADEVEKVVGFAKELSSAQGYKTSPKRVRNL